MTDIQEQETAAGSVAADVQPQPGTAGGERRTSEPWWRGVLEFVVAFAIMIAAIWGIRAFVVEPFEIPSGSMLQTIQIGDRIYSEKISIKLEGTPKQGDIVTFTNPRDPSETLIKRVIAVGGQTVDLRDGVVYVDGEPLDEPYTNGQATKPMTSDLSYKGAVLSVDSQTGAVELNETGARTTQQISYPYTVPEGYFWAMGDNRSNSADSRVIGAVPVSNISGRAVLRYWPIWRNLDSYEVDLGFTSFEAHPLQLAIGGL